MHVRPYTQDDYKTLCAWWTDHSWPHIPSDILSDTGFIAVLADKPISAGFLYISNSNFAFMDWLVSDKQSSHDDRGQALDLVIQSIFSLAKERGIKQICTISNHKRLMDRYQGHGFTLGEYSTTLIKRID